MSDNGEEVRDGEEQAEETPVEVVPEKAKKVPMTKEQKEALAANLGACTEQSECCSWGGFHVPYTAGNW